MVMTVAYPKKAVSLTEKVLERVYGNHSTSSSGNLSFDRDDNYEEDDESNVELMPIGAERTKNVLILMSDAGGGHRASADEAIRDAFKIEFGEEYRVISFLFSLLICFFNTFLKFFFQHNSNPQAYLPSPSGFLFENFLFDL